MSYYPYPGYAPMPQKHEVIKVSGRGGAETFQMLPNSSVLLLDETAPLVWLKTTDGAGYPTITPYTIEPYQPEPEVNVKSLEERITKIEEMLANVKSNPASSRHTKSTNDSN